MDTQEAIGEVINDILSVLQNRCDVYSNYEDEPATAMYIECKDIMNFILSNYNEELDAYLDFLESTNYIKKLEE